MKKIKTLVIFLLCTTTQFVSAAGHINEGPSPGETASYTLYQSDEDEKEKMVFVGVGIVMGIFSPGDVNEYINDDLPSNVYSTMGSFDMITNFSLKLSLTIRPHRMIDIVPFGEFGWAPKYILVDNGESYYYSFTKISPGIAAKVHIPFGSGRHSLFFAPGVTYNLLSFKDGGSSPVSKAGGLGGRFHVGFNLGLGKVLIQPFLGYDYAKAIDRDVYYGEFELNFSSFQLGVDFCF